MMARRIKIYFDGGCRPNPGRMETAVVTGGAAVVVRDAGIGSSMDAEWLALIAALRARAIHAAILDLTDPEPIPPGHELWSLDNALVTMHLAAIPTPATRERGFARFLANCESFRNGTPLEATVDLSLGY